MSSSESAGNQALDLIAPLLRIASEIQPNSIDEPVEFQEEEEDPDGVKAARCTD